MGLGARRREYAEKRLAPYRVAYRKRGEDMAARQQKDNTATIGGAGWLAGRAKPDLACAAPCTRKRQRNPAVADLRAAAHMVDETPRAPGNRPAGGNPRPRQPLRGQTHTAKWPTKRETDREANRNLTQTIALNPTTTT